MAKITVQNPSSKGVEFDHFRKHENVEDRKLLSDGADR